LPNAAAAAAAAAGDDDDAWWLQVADKEKFLADSGLWLLGEGGRPLYNDTGSPYFGGRHRHLPCEGRLAWVAP
jgi:hypothetical protein